MSKRARLTSALVAPLVVAVVSLSSIPAGRAAEDDGLYGRFDGDLALHVGAGAALMKGGPALAARLEALYLSTAGVYAHYADSLAQSDAAVVRSISAGVALQPLFLARFAKNWEGGPARLDLFADSFAIHLGGFWHEPRGSTFTNEPGLELALALSFPLFAEATGPFLDARAALRWRPIDLRSSPEGGASLFDRGALLTLSVSWHQIIATHLVDAADRSPR